MKLLNKSTLYYLLFLVPVLVVSGFVFHYILAHEINENVDESLLAQKKTVESRFVLKDSTQLHFYNDADDDVKISILSTDEPLKNKYQDIFLYDSSEAEMLPFRQLQSSFKKDGNNFEIIITRSNIKSDELAEAISLSLVIMSVLLLIGFLIANRIISKKLFKPFYESLEKLNALSFNEMELNAFKSSSIKEFNELNKTLNKMTAKMLSDYNNQKQFTENAAHELQTPLAVIKSRIDLLIQSTTISAEDMAQLEEIEKAAGKVSRLNKTLLLLSKIENRQFEESTTIKLVDFITKSISNFEDHLSSKNIEISKRFTANPELQINPILAEILFSNLIQNAIRYSSENNKITIEITDNSFIISNLGESLKGNENKLFNRFAKFNNSGESLGLGLAIVKQICDYYGFNIQYDYFKHQHFFKVGFNY